MDEQIKHIIVPFTCKAMGDTGQVQGLGGAFGNKDQGGDILEFGSVGKSLAEHAKEGTMPNMFFAHNMNEPVGHWNKIEESKKGIDSDGQTWIGKGIPKAEQAYQLAKNPGEKGLSIGYQTVVAEYDSAKKVNLLKEIKLREISITPYPMNKKALITSVKTFMEELNKKYTIRDLEKILRDADFSNAEAKAFLASVKTAYDEETREALESSDEFKSIMDSIKSINTLAKR